MSLLYRSNGSPRIGLSPKTRTLYGVPFGVVACIIAGVALMNGQQHPATGSNGSQFLYIVDSNHAELTSEILVVDPESKATIRTYRAGFHPDIALSRDRARLYLAYDYLTPDKKETGLIEVIDTSSGVVLASVPNPDRWMAIGDIYDSTMAVSADSRWLYVYRIHQEPDKTESYGVAIFDTSINRFLPDVISLPNCDASLIIPAATGWSLSVVCSGTTDLRTVRIGKNGVPDTRLPIGTQIREHGMSQGNVVGAFALDDRKVGILMQDDRYSVVDSESRQVVRQGALRLSGTVTAPQGEVSNKFIRFQLLQQYANKLFFALTRSFNNLQLADVIASVDASTLQQSQSVIPRNPFWSLTVSKQRRKLYALDPINARVDIFDLPDVIQKDRIDHLGASPTIVLPAQ
jgi:hypothetical protein